MKYFIMAWDNDSSSERYYNFYFVADKKGRLILFDSVKEAESFGHKACKYFNIASWYSYMVGDKILDINRLIIKEK